MARVRIVRWGNSLAIRLPPELAEKAHLAEGSKVDIAFKDGKLTISSPRPRYRLSELLQGYKIEHRHSEMDWAPVNGNEAW